MTMEEERRRQQLWNIVLLLCVKKKWKRAKTIWSKEMFQRRSQKGSYYNTFLELYSSPPDEAFDFFAYTRMPKWVFDELLEAISPLISKNDTRLRDAIPAAARLEATLRFLITGMNYSQLQFVTRISNQALSKIIPEVCEAIYLKLKDKYLKVGKT